jgi:hypothetical protein
MGEPEVNQSTEVESTGLCRGEVLVGPEDPRTMSLEEFKASPQLFYHGALFHFRIDRNWTSYYVSEDSSLISGSGFYTTPTRTEAEHYSSIRKTSLGTEPKKDLVPVVLEVMPYQAKMYDFTTGNNPEKLGAVSDQFFQEFLDFLRNTPDRKAGEQPDTDAPAWLQELHKRHHSVWRQQQARILENISKGLAEDIPSKITINVLRYDDYRNSVPEMETGLDFLDKIERDKHKDHVIDNGGRYRTKEGKYIVEHSSRTKKHGGELLRLFLQSKGYDGIISSVKGDDPSVQKLHLEYVFYPGSLHKIGTYDQWQQEK